MIVNCSDRQLFVTIWYSMIIIFHKCVCIRKCTYQYIGLLYPTSDSEHSLDALAADRVVDDAQVLARVLHLGFTDDQGSSHLLHAVAEFHCCLASSFGNLEPPGGKCKYQNLCQFYFRPLHRLFFFFYFIGRNYLMEEQAKYTNTDNL